MQDLLSDLYKKRKKKYLLIPKSNIFLLIYPLDAMEWKSTLLGSYQRSLRVESTILSVYFYSKTKGSLI